ncbi:hypothetical protein JW964_07920 [candidate division KSB1 bacterium]|nr:hypothetical protein [candidate division KSB1 bacterium]
MKSKFVFSLIIIMGSFLLFSSCDKALRETMPGTTAQQIALMPATDVLGYVNFQQIKKSDFFEMFRDSLHKDLVHNDEYLDFVDSSGFDFEKDISELFFAGKFDSSRHDMEGLAVVYGNFNPEKIMTFIAKESRHKELVATEYQNFKIYTGKDEDKAICFVDSTIFLGGDEVLVKAWLDNSIQKKTQLASELQARLEQVKFKTDCWLVTQAADILNKLHLDEPLKEAHGLSSLKNFNLSMKLTDQINFNGEMECADAENAGLFKDAIKGFIATAKLSTSEDRETVDIINKIDVDHHQNHISVNFQFTKEDLEKLRKAKHPFGKHV